MGNDNPNKTSQSQSPTQQVEQFDQLQLIIQLKLLLKDVLTQFENQEEDVKIFQDEMKRGIPGMRRGENFQGRVDGRGHVYGIVKIFNHVGDKGSIYFGEIDQGIPKGRGININANLVHNQKLKKFNVVKTTYEAYLMQSWQQNKETPLKGSLLKKTPKTTQFFKGEFINKQIHRGKLILKQNNIVKMTYVGEFKNNRIHGRGTMTIPGIYRYSGWFEDERKMGIGEEFDQIRNTYYVGEFQSNKRHGYGELTYRNRDQVKLKGFWNDGIVRPGDGMYVSKDGVFLEKLGNDINLI